MTPLELLCRLMIEGERRGLPRLERIVSVEALSSGDVRFVGPVTIGGTIGAWRVTPDETVVDVVRLLKPLPALHSMAREILRVPLVVRDRRPTREEEGQASHWFRSWNGGPSVYTSHSDGRMYPESEEAGVVLADGSSTPGEVWTALNPDGSPVMVEGEG